MVLNNNPVLLNNPEEWVEGAATGQAVVGSASDADVDRVDGAYVVVAELARNILQSPDG